MQRRPSPAGVLTLLIAGALVAWFAVGDQPGPRDEPPRPAPPAAPAPRLRASQPAPPAVAPGTIRGAVFGGGDEPQPLASQTVTLEVPDAPPRTTAADAWGRFTFEDVPAGEPATVSASTDGCATDRVTGIRLLPGETRDVGFLTLHAAVTFRVFVLDEAGVPLAGATVEAYRAGELPENWDEFAPTSSPDVPASCVTTGADGLAVFEVPAGREATFVATAPGRARVARARNFGRPGDSGALHLVLPTPAPLSGTVIDAAGAPVAGALVVARIAPRVWDRTHHGTREEGPGQTVRVRAGSDGRFVVADLPPGTVEIAACAPGDEPLYVLTARTPGAEEIEVTLRETATVEGRVTGPSGAGVAGATVRAGSAVSLPTRAAVTASDGTYRLRSLPAGNDGLVEVDPPAGWRHARRWPHRSVRVDFVAGAAARADFALVPAAVVEGRVLRAGTPVAGAAVRVLSIGETPKDARWEAFGISDAAGRYRVDDVPPGRVAVAAAETNAWGPFDDVRGAYVHGATPARAPVFELGPGARVERDVELLPGPSAADRRDDEARWERQADEILGAGRVKLAIRVLADEGRPLREPEVAVHREDFVDRDGDRRRLLEFARRIHSHGRAERTERIDGRHRTFVVAAVDADHDLATVRVTVPEGATEVPVEIVLPPLAVLRGRVTSGGAPIAGAQVFDGRQIAARTGADGSFELRRRAGGTAIGVVAAGHVRASRDEVSVPGDDVVFDLARERVVEGVVVDAGGAPVPGVKVVPLDEEGDVLVAYGTWDHGRWRSAVTDAAGRFRLLECPDAPLWLQVEGARPGAGVARETFRDVDAAKPVRLVVARGFPIAGRVVGPDGEPVVRADVAASGADAATEFEADRETTTDHEGRFRFDGLLAGTYAVDVSPRGDLAPARVRVAAGAPEVVVTLERAGVLSGYAYDEHGEAFTTVGILATRLDAPGRDEPPWERRLEDVTDRDGAFRILVPPRSRWRLGFVARFVRIGELDLRGGEDVAAGTERLELRAVPRER